MVRSPSRHHLPTRNVQDDARLNAGIWLYQRSPSSRRPESSVSSLSSIYKAKHKTGKKVSVVARVRVQDQLHCSRCSSFSNYKFATAAAVPPVDLPLPASRHAAGYATCSYLGQGQGYDIIQGIGQNNGQGQGLGYSQGLEIRAKQTRAVKVKLRDQCLGIELYFEVECSAT